MGSESMLEFGCSLACDGTGGAAWGAGGAALSRDPGKSLSILSFKSGLTTEAMPARSGRRPRIEAIPGTNVSGKFCLSNVASCSSCHGLASSILAGN